MIRRLGFPEPFACKMLTMSAFDPKRTLLLPDVVYITLGLDKAKGATIVQINPAVGDENVQQVG